jgi:hypothetical protein
VKTTRIAPTSCPTCHVTHDAATNPTGEARPYPGSFAVCIQCGQLNHYDENLQLVRPSLTDLIDCQIKRPEVWKQIDVLQRLVRQRNQKLLELGLSL